MTNPIDHDPNNKEIEYNWKLPPHTSWADGFARGVVLALFMLLAATIILLVLTSISPYR